MKREIAGKEQGIKEINDSLASREKELSALKSEQGELTSRLKNAEMSNELAFNEIKSEAMNIQRERDSLLSG